MKRFGVDGDTTRKLRSLGFLRARAELILKYTEQLLTAESPRFAAPPGDLKSAIWETVQNKPVAFAQDFWSVRIDKLPA